MATPPRTSGSAATPNGASGKQDQEELEEDKMKLREIGDQAVWSLSSCKPGFGVNQLRDDSVETYWQSDGTQPHLVNIQFRRKTTVHSVAIYADYKSDESYTPNKISVRVGNNFHDLQEVELLELGQPSGWIRIPLADARGRPVRTFMIQIAALSNHQNGRDTHMRQIKVYAPTQDNVFHHMPNFSTVECNMFSIIR
ncbi:anaphase-promoting complex subunit 10-like [Acanthaster planci]|uniref:Anaphase-promoting complex subunit 10 n=1 Tax=Acanthaster planci TaxID=133434 RepID=A0A8B7Z0D0_ACAPL|nr:anaphase-promoting complex subunit 10-like [Acanthaster planci]